MSDRTIYCKLAILTPLVSLFLYAQAGYCEKAPSIDNFQKVCPALWRGAAPSKKAMQELSAAGVKTVVDLRLSKSASKKEAALARKLGLHYFHIPLGYGALPVEKVNEFLQIVTTPRYQPVFIHCRQGCDRTGALVGVYRMLVHDWTFDKSYIEMRQHHFKPWLTSLKKTVASWQPVGPAFQSQVAEKQTGSF